MTSLMHDLDCWRLLVGWQRVGWSAVTLDIRVYVMECRKECFLWLVERMLGVGIGVVEDELLLLLLNYPLLVE